VLDWEECSGSGLRQAREQKRGVVGRRNAWECRGNAWQLVSSIYCLEWIKWREMLVVAFFRVL
jgi:hypothetical protein